MKTFLVTLIFGFATALPAMAQDANGVMMVVKGDIKVTSGKDGKTEAAKVGRKVFSGDSIVAGLDSRAKIVMSDRNILNVSPDSKITIEKYTNDAKTDSKNVEIKVEYGKVRAQIEQKYDGDKNKFNIKTPTAVAGVRGTDFITGFNRATRETSIVTFSGMVAVGTAGPNGQIQNAVFVRPGQITNVGEGKAPEAPKAMPKEELNNMNQDSANAPQPQAQEQAAAPAPAAAEPKKEEPKKEPVQQTAAPAGQEPAKDQPKKEAAPAAASNAPANSGDGSRSPASTNGNAPATGTAANTGNADKAPAAGTATGGSTAKKAPETRSPASISPSMGPIVMDSSALPQGQGPNIPKMPVTMPSVTMPTTNPFVNEVIRNGGKSKVTIEIRK